MSNIVIMQQLYYTNAKTIDGIEKLIGVIREQNYHAMRIQMIEVIKKIEHSMQVLGVIEAEQLVPEGLLNSKKFQKALEQVLQAQKMEDYVLVGDLYELLVLPELLDMQEVIRQLKTDLVHIDYFEKNMQVLQEADAKLYKKIQNVEREGINCQRYQIEATNVGAFTLAIDDGDGKYYLHSNRNPMTEARQYVRRRYDAEKEKWIVIGMGMGYHIHEFLRLDPDMQIVVFEPDANIIYCMLQIDDWRKILKRIIIIQSEEELQKYLKEQYELVLYRPELRHLKNTILKDMLVKIADRQDSIADHKDIFCQNFRENIRNCTGYVDELYARIQGKKVVIVAGGPSLDQNIDQLIHRSEDIVLIAVGTVYKLLLQKGIKVDCVVFADIAAYPQIQGIENENIPIAILATADRRIGRYYQGNKYLVCQEGYIPALRYAEEKGYQYYESGESVATLALDIAIRMQAKSIAFVGLDLAYDGKKAHATGTMYETFSGEKMREVEGIYGGILNTSQVFNQYREWMEKRIQRKDATMRIIDATEGGAKKAGFEVMSLRDYMNI